jgi:hypothetical protein
MITESATINIMNTRWIMGLTIMITPVMKPNRTPILTENKYERICLTAADILQVDTNDISLPVVMAFVEQSSLALGFRKPEALNRTLES